MGKDVRIHAKVRWDQGCVGWVGWGEGMTQMQQPLWPLRYPCLPSPPPGQFYWGRYEVPRYVDAALYLMDLKAQGLIREVGMTNFDVPRLEAMRAKGVEIASNQVNRGRRGGGARHRRREASHRANRVAPPPHPTLPHPTPLDRPTLRHSASRCSIPCWTAAPAWRWRSTAPATA